MSQELVKKEEAQVPAHDGLTTMQRRFCEYLILNEGRTTNTAAAIAAGYAESSAAQEASRLIRKPHIDKYIKRRTNEVNRAYVVTKSNYIKRQSVLSQRLVDEGKIKDASVYETLIGKATGQFSETNVNLNLTATDLKEREDEIKRLRELNEQRIADTKLLDSE